jgi:hypothetical protein
MSDSKVGLAHRTSDPGNTPLKVQIPGAQIPIPTTGLPGTTLPPSLQGFQAQFEEWINKGGVTRLGENCFLRGVMSATVGGGGGLALGAFLAPFDTMNGLKVCLIF